MYTVQRPLIAQQFDTFGVVVGVAPAQSLKPDFQITALIDDFLITVPTAALNSVIIGGSPGVVAGPPPTGLELLAGTTVRFKIDHGGRQLYELQRYATDIDGAIRCVNITDKEAIPFVVWDLSQVFVVAVAATNISVGTFRAVYI